MNGDCDWIPALVSATADLVGYLGAVDPKSELYKRGMRILGHVDALLAPEAPKAELKVFDGGKKMPPGA